MNRSFIWFTVGLLITGLLNTISVFSQENINPESEYLRIRTLAFTGDLSNASVEARNLVNAFPSYGDARILLGRILAWQKDYVNAAAVIDTLLLTDPDNADALSARMDITQWSKANSTVTTDIRAGYSFDTYRVPTHRFWQVFSAGAGHRFSWGPGSVALNTGNLITDGPPTVNATEFQIEAEAYPKISSRNYAYLSYAFSPGEYFPGHRAVIEIWQLLPASWSVSTGLNYYYFTRNIFIGLASVEKYIGHYWLSAKGFIYFKDNGPTFSAYLNARRYFNDSNYLQVTLGTGTAPDEPFDLKTDVERISAHSIRLAYNVSLSNKLTMRIGAGYSSEEYIVNLKKSAWRNRFEGGVNLIYALKMK